MNSVITNSQKNNFERDGFLILNNFISPEICNNLIQRAYFLIEQFNPNKIKTIFSTKDQDQHQSRNQYFLESGDKIHYFFEESSLDENGNLKFEKLKSINKFGHAIHDLDPVFNIFSRMHKIAILASDLGFKNPFITQSMYICKQPKIGAEVNCHQDATFLYVHNEPIIGFWFALEDATLENGCLWAIPGGHKEKLKSRFIREKNNTVRMEMYDDTPWALEKMVPLEVPQGSVIVLSGTSPHMSKENTSSKSRHAYTLHFMSQTAQYAEDNWLQRSKFTTLLDSSFAASLTE